jgi:uncharacterized protein YcbX
MDPVGGSLRLSRIRAYPLKGAAGFDLPKARFDEFGIPGDRRWMLARPDGSFISQRSHPRLALMRVFPGDGAGGNEAEWLRFEVRAPGMDPFHLSSAPAPGGWMEVRLFGERVRGRVVEGGTEWFSEALREECRLVFFPENLIRPVDAAFAPGHKTGFTDGYPLLLTTEESLGDLNRRLKHPSSMLRFRPNLVVVGGRPWEEDSWRVLEIGGVRLELVKPCARCSVTTVDPGSGTRGKEPLRTLMGFRGHGGKGYFGQNAVFSGNGSFRVGDSVRILEKGDARPPLG